MSQYNLSLSLNHINENNYDMDITADLEPNYFIAVTKRDHIEDGTQRVVTVSIMVLKGTEGGVSHTNTGLFVRRASENSIKVILMKNKQEVDTAEINYPD